MRIYTAKLYFRNERAPRTIRVQEANFWPAWHSTIYEAKRIYEQQVREGIEPGRLQQVDLY